MAKSIPTKRLKFSHPIYGMQILEEQCPPPSPEILRALESLLQSEKVLLGCYVGGAHIEIAEVLHQYIPHRYYLMDYFGRHRLLFHWDMDENENFTLKPVQPSRPDCLKVPFSDEGMPPHDLLIKDIPFHPNQFKRIIVAQKVCPPTYVLFLYGAQNADRLDIYDWEEHEDFVVGRSRSPSRLKEADLQTYYTHARRILRHFPPDQRECE